MGSHIAFLAVYAYNNPIYKTFFEGKDDGNGHLRLQKPGGTSY